MEKNEVNQLIKDCSEMAQAVYKGVTCSGEQAIGYFKAVLEANTERFFEQQDVEPPKETKMEKDSLSTIFSKVIADINARQEEEAPSRFIEARSIPEAHDWAQYFCQYNPAIDEDYMVSWFANAMIAIQDRIYENNHVIPKCTCSCGKK